MARNTLSRSLHDLGLSAWFGGTLANAVALNPAAAQATTSTDVGADATTGWDRWTPVNAAALRSHAMGSLGQIVGNKGRSAGQGGVAASKLEKPPLTAAPLALSAYSGSLCKRVVQ